MNRPELGCPNPTIELSLHFDRAQFTRTLPKQRRCCTNFELMVLPLALNCRCWGILRTITLAA